jgi:hypothetical protein
VRYLLEQQNLTQRDLIPEFGSESAVPMFLAKLRGPQSALDLVFPNAGGEPYEAGNLLKRILYPAFADLGLPKTGVAGFSPICCNSAK